MHSELIQIGNSKGVRLPKALLKQVGIKNKINVIIKNGAIIILPDKQPRKGWGEKFEKMHKAGEDQLIEFSGSNQFDEQEWEW